MKSLLKSKTRAVGALVFFVALLTGCATYQTKVTQAREQMRDGQYSLAATTIEPLATKPGRDQLVYLLDYATALQLAGDYSKSAEMYLLADQMSEVKDYTSLSKETASILVSEEMTQYKGDDYEKVLINALNSINFLQQDNLEGALVEVRRTNEKLRLYKFEAKKDYEQSTFATYLGGIIWEADRKWDDAFIDYEKTYKLNPNIDLLKEDLVRAAYFSRRKQKMKEYMAKFGVEFNPKWRDKDYGELILVYQQGWGPRKKPNPQFHRIPKLYPTPSRTQQAKLVVKDGPEVESQMVYSVTDVAMKTLGEQLTALVAKRLAAVAAKEIVADQIRQKNQLLGDITSLAMRAVDRADLRQWSTLPSEFQFARVFLPVGKHKVKVVGLTRRDTPSGEAMEEWKEIEILPRKKTFMTWRSFN